MNYSNVTHSDKYILANIPNGKEVVIDKSIANLYHCKVINKETGRIHYNAITYMDQQTLRLVENFIRGRAFFSDSDRKTLNNIVVRFGWLDKTLNQLIWVPLVDLVEKFVRKELKGTEKGKFQEICKQLSLSLRDARTLHVEGDDVYNPRAVLGHIPVASIALPEEITKMNYQFLNQGLHH